MCDAASFTQVALAILSTPKKPMQTNQAAPFGVIGGPPESQGAAPPGQPVVRGPGAAGARSSGTGSGTMLTGPFGIDPSLLGIAKPGGQGNTLLGS